MTYILALLALVILQIVTAQLPLPLPDLPTLPPITIPPITLPPLVGPVALVCPAGFQSLLLDCFPCPTGQTSILGGACTLCPEGSYAPGPGGAASCTPCASGFATSGREACAEAPAKAVKAGKGKGKA